MDSVHDAHYRRTPSHRIPSGSESDRLSPGLELNSAANDRRALRAATRKAGSVMVVVAVLDIAVTGGTNSDQ